jgi:hypothetical protein
VQVLGVTFSDVHAATSKTTPVDADEIPLIDSAASWGLKKLTWANLKATIGAAYALLAHGHSGTTDGSKLAQANTHESPDTDAAPTSLHHTLGTGANNACAGNDSRLSDARIPTTHGSDKHSVAYEASGAVSTHAGLTTGAHSAGAVADDVYVDKSADVSAGAITLAYAVTARSQFVDLGIATTITVTAVNSLVNGGAMLLTKWKTTGAGITFTWPSGRLTTGTAPGAAGTHEVQIERDTAGVLRVYYIPTPTA